MFSGTERKRSSGYKIRNHRKNKVRKQASYSQDPLLKRINYFKDYFCEELFDDRGYCHGLSLLWLKKMAQRKECCFFNVIEKIIHFPKKDLGEWCMDNDVVEFLTEIYRGQNPRKVLGVDQGDVATILGLQGVYALDTSYSDTGLLEMLKTFHMKGCGLILWGGLNPKKDKHTVAVFYRDKHFYYYDANFKGKMRVCRNENTLHEWICQSLYDYFDDLRPKTHQLKLKVLPMTISPKQTLQQVGFFAGLTSIVGQSIEAIYSHLPGPS